MNLDAKRKIIEDVCKLDGCGFLDPEVFKKGYSTQTLAVYSMLSSYNGKVSAAELMEMYDPEHRVDPEVEEDCMLALWALYKGGFLELNTLTDEGVEIISEQFGLDQFGQKNN